MIRGVVRDVKGQPVEGAVVTMIMTDTGRKFTVKTNRSGEFLQIGLAGGAYTVQAEKDKLSSTTEKAMVKASARRRRSTWCWARRRQPRPQQTRRSSPRKAPS